MLDALPKAAFAVLASSSLLKRLASRYGMRRPGSFARRFIAGETTAEAIEAARQIEQQGLTITLDLLGEGVSSTEDAAAATRAYADVLTEVERAGVGRNISVKLTQLGLGVDRATSIDNLRRILDVATPGGFFVRIDMENSEYTEATLDVFETVWKIGYRNVGVVIQSALKRSAADVDRLNAMGARVRLVKGAYREPGDVAFQKKADVDASFDALMRSLLTRGHYPAIATHDPAMIDAAKAFATDQHLARDAFEFQMLYGIRRDLQASLLGDGYRVRVYVPFGKEWFPYFMRRLGERPANVGFVLRSVFSERGQARRPAAAP
jgi:proline dehydrogenase